MIASLKKKKEYNWQLYKEVNNSAISREPESASFQWSFLNRWVEGTVNEVDPRLIRYSGQICHLPGSVSIWGRVQNPLCSYRSWFRPHCETEGHFSHSVFIRKSAAAAALNYFFRLFDAALQSRAAFSSRERSLLKTNFWIKHNF